MIMTIKQFEMSPGKSLGSISPLRTPSSSPGRSSLSGAGPAPMFQDRQSPCFEKSTGWSPAPGRSPSRSPAASPTVRPSGLNKRTGISNRAAPTQQLSEQGTNIQSELNLLGVATGSSPSRAVEDIPLGMHSTPFPPIKPQLTT